MKDSFIIQHRFYFKFQAVHMDFTAPDVTSSVAEIAITTPPVILQPVSAIQDVYRITRALSVSRETMRHVHTKIRLEF